MPMDTKNAHPDTSVLAGRDVVTAAILVIGDEILSGRTKDKNIGTIADHLTTIGIQLKEVRIVTDDSSEIVAGLDALRHRYDYVFTTGGIGPTHDDITADAVAQAFGVSIDIDPRAVAVMAPHYATRNLDFTPARMRMARIPAGAELVDNPVSKAPGFMIGNVIVMAGVPNIMQAMLESATAYLQTGRKMVSVTVTIWRAESDLADLFASVQGRFPMVSMGSYPFIDAGRFGAHLVLRSIEAAAVAAAEADLRQTLAKAGMVD
jgi:molybdenum cofactor synthesis domain-containing protein